MFNVARHRLVPLHASHKFFPENGKNSDGINETEDLRATTVAFILGVRASSHPSSKTIVSEIEDDPDRTFHVNTQPRIMPGMQGTERFQQLCSLQYLQMYFSHVLCWETIDLSARMNTSDLEGLTQCGGPIESYLATIHQAKVDNIPINSEGNPYSVNNVQTLMHVQDIALKSGRRNSEASNSQQTFQGIFARDFGPFLKGRGSLSYPVSCANDPESTFQVSRNAGDDLAFAMLDNLLMQKGITDWRPDGIVLSKGVNDPSDRMSDEYLEARDGQLYNIRVQGPAITTTWTGERSLETLPLDKVFIVLVADCWFDVENLVNTEGWDLKAFLAGNGEKTRESLKQYNKRRESELNKTFDEELFKSKQKETYLGTSERTVLVNFRVQVSTSSQMVNYSEYSSKGNVHSIHKSSKRRRLEGTSRMGLKLCEAFGEYIVGGWQIGQVLDNSASRAAMPKASNIGVKTSPNSSALNVNVNVSWYTADRLCRSFNNAEGTVRGRHETQNGVPKNPVNMQANVKDFTEALIEQVNVADTQYNDAQERLGDLTQALADFTAETPENERAEAKRAIVVANVVLEDLKTKMDASQVLLGRFRTFAKNGPWYNPPAPNTV